MKMNVLHHIKEVTAGVKEVSRAKFIIHCATNLARNVLDEPAAKKYHITIW